MLRAAGLSRRALTHAGPAAIVRAHIPLQPIPGATSTQAAALWALPMPMARRFQSTEGKNAQDAALGPGYSMGRLNPRVPRPATPPKPEQKYKYVWRDPRTFTSWKDYWDELNPKFLIEKAYWQESYSRNKPLTVAWFMFVFFVWTPACIAVFYDQFLRPDPTSKFPYRVRKHLRKAIYWAKYKRDDVRAMQSFMLAFQAMQDLRMDPFSDECMGAYMLMIKYLGTLQRFDQALDICMMRRQACLEWIANLNELVDRGLVSQFGDMIGDPEVIASVLPNAPGENLWSRRTRLLKWMVVMSAEMGNQCHNEGSYEALHAKGRELLEWAVAEAVKENQRRFQKGVKSSENDWLSPDQFGNLFQMLGNAYQQSGDDDLSIPLFFKGLQLCKDHCDQTLLMISLATSFFNVDPAAAVPSARRTEVYSTLSAMDREALPKTARESVEAADNWTHIVGRRLNEIPLWEYTDSCKQAQIFQKLLQGEMLWAEGKYEAAREKFEFSAGVARLFERPEDGRAAEEALKREIPACEDTTKTKEQGENVETKA